MGVVQNFTHLFMESAPYLLLGMLIAGLIHQWVPSSLVERILGRSSSVVTAALIGAPLPLCSCSVIPVAMGIRRSGASKASTASFLVATPETGVDSVGITYALMGPFMAIARPVSAVCSAIVAGLAVRHFGDSTPSPQAQPEASTCSSCCTHAEPAKRTFSAQLLAVFSYGYGKLLKDFMSWLLVGLFFAALIQTYVPADFFAQYGQGLGAMVLIVLISIPMYICATASTPIAVGLMASGVSPGAALVFMLAGPATNIATLMVIKNELGKKELLLYLVSVIGSALVAGLIVDYVFTAFSLTPSLNYGEHGDMTSWVYRVSAVIVAVLMLFQYGKMVRARFL